MSSVKGSPKTGGRKKGTPNKKETAHKQYLADLMEKYDYCPFEAMIVIAITAQEEGEGKDLQLAGQMSKELAQYIKPKLKAVEMTGSLDNVMVFEKPSWLK